MVTERLTAIWVAKADKPGWYCDGGGLYLKIDHGQASQGCGSKSWVLRYKRDGRSRYHGLGPLHTIGLADARSRAAAARREILDGGDPVEIRRASKIAVRLEQAKTMSFDQCRDAYLKAHRAGWKNAKQHGDQWKSTLATYATPIFGALPVAAVDTTLVLKMLEPIWSTKSETASRVRGRVENILDWARVRGFRQGENPARWKGHLDHLLPARSKVAKVEHHAALPYGKIFDFITALRQREATAARALELAILTATRTSEVLEATWGEVDLAAKVWVIPPERMKGKREHRIPLSDAALKLIKNLPRESDFLFPGQRRGKPLSNMAMLNVLERMGRSDLTTHGFRSTFRDWGSDCTSYPNELLEMALAHVVDDKTEAAYRRSDMFQKRIRLMQDWASFCDAMPAKSADVVPIRG